MSFIQTQGGVLALLSHFDVGYDCKISDFGIMFHNREKWDHQSVLRGDAIIQEVERDKYGSVYCQYQKIADQNANGNARFQINSSRNLVCRILSISSNRCCS